jgi:hypothetical protein
MPAILEIVREIIRGGEIDLSFRDMRESWTILRKRDVFAFPALLVGTKVSPGTFEQLLL